MRRVWWLVVGLLTLVLPAGAGASPVAQPVGEGGVVRLAGTPHIWVLEGGQLHWVGDTRVIQGRVVNWGDRHTLDLAALRRVPIGDPWLSAGLLRMGEPIYLVKWDAHQPAPVLQHIESLEDVALFGITGANHAQFMLEQPAWEQRHGLGAAGLARAPLVAADRVALDPLGEAFRFNSGVATRERRVVRTDDEWRALWTQLTRDLGAPLPPPLVDFAREMVVFAAMGERPTGGFGVEIVRAAPVGGAFEVVVTERSAGTGCATPAMVTAPAAAVRVPRSDLPVRWIERAGAYPCG